MINFAPYPIHCNVLKEDGTYEEAILLYVESGNSFSNDIWTCVLKNGGLVKHYQTSQVRVNANATFEIKK